MKLLIDADAWQIWGENESYCLYFLPPLFKKRSRATARRLGVVQCPFPSVLIVSLTSYRLIYCLFEATKHHQS